MPTLYENIAVAIDFSEQSKKSFSRALELAEEYGATLHLISAIYTHSNAAVETFDPKYAELVYQTQLNELKEQATSVKEVVTHVQYGSVLIEYERADLIVIGATGLNAVERVILGSVSSNVLRFAKCDVLIVK